MQRMNDSSDSPYKNILSLRFINGQKWECLSHLDNLHSILEAIQNGQNIDCVNHTSEFLHEMLIVHILVAFL